MKSFFKLLGSVILVFILLGVGALILWTVLRTAWHAFDSLSENVQVAVAAGLVTVVTTIGSVVYTKIKEKKLQIEANNNQHKQKLYTEFTGNILELMTNPDKGNDQEWVQKIRLDFMKNAFLWADPKVLNAYRNFRINAQFDDSGLDAIYNVATMLLEFRKDLGLSNKKLSHHTIVDILFDRSDSGSYYERYPEKK